MPNTVPRGFNDKSVDLRIVDFLDAKRPEVLGCTANRRPFVTPFAPSPAPLSSNSPTRRGPTWQVLERRTLAAHRLTKPQIAEVTLLLYFDGAMSSANVRSKASVVGDRWADAFLVAYVPTMRLPSFVVSLRFAASSRECVPSASNTWTL
jgi:hypothetical protein